MKKKISLIAAIAIAVFTTGNVNGQDFKPEAGAKNIEVNFTPFGDNPIDINSLRLRYFLDTDMAIRVGLHISSNSIDDAEGISDAALNLGGLLGSAVTNYESSEFEFGIDIGFEKHWAGTDRLSPYWGLEVRFASFSESENADVDNGIGGTVDAEFTGGGTAFGANLLIGADFYFAPKFYVGTEIGLGFVSTSRNDFESTFNGIKNTLEGPSSFSFGEDVNSAIRVGFIF